MTVLRQPLLISAGNRSSSLLKDELLTNCYPEAKGQGVNVLRRFGYAALAQYGQGAGLGLFGFNNSTISVVGTTARLGATVLGTVDGSSVYQYTTTGANSGFFLKNNAAGYVYDGATFSPVTNNYPATTVPGVAYLDGFVFVLTPDGRVYNRNVNAPALGNALDFISTQGSDAGVAIAKHLSFILAFGQNSITFFYNNNNPTGSPLLPNKSATLNIGCANGNSVVQTKNTVFFVGQTKQRGRSVYAMEGLNAKPISTPFVDRLLAADNLSKVFAYFIERNGHPFYLLTLKSSNLTLAYDQQTDNWGVWSSTARGMARPVSAAKLINGNVQLTIPNHGFQNGQIGVVDGTADPKYQGNFLINVIDSNTIQYTPGMNFSSTGINSSEINREVIDS